MDRGAALSHRKALILMLIVPVLWSMAGIFARQLEHLRGYEIVFWRSFFLVLFISAFLLMQKRLQWQNMFRVMGWLGFLSGIMWGTVFCCFMLALTLTTVANTLIVGSITPLLTAFLAWLLLKQKILWRTGLAILFTFIGMACMFAGNVTGIEDRHLYGMLLALTVPVAYSVNFIILGKSGGQTNMIPGILLGGVFSAVAMLPWVIPFEISGEDVVILVVLGFFQLGLPCILLVYAAQSLQPAEIALLSLLEVLLGPLWVWIGIGEAPSQHTLIGGSIILLCLLFHELIPMLQSQYVSGKVLLSRGKE